MYDIFSEHCIIVNKNKKCTASTKIILTWISMFSFFFVFELKYVHSLFVFP